MSLFKTRIPACALTVVLALLFVACGGNGPASPPASQATGTLAAPVVELVEAAPPDSNPADPAATSVPSETPPENNAGNPPVAPEVTATPAATATPGPTATPVAALNPPLPGAISLPPGFRIGLYAANVPNARSMVLGPDGTLFVGTRDAGSLYAVRDTDGDYVADDVITLATGMDWPNGVAVHDGALYVAEAGRILRYDDIEASLPNLPQPVVIYDGFPGDRAHGWRYMRFGPDGRLYVGIGVPCNVCEVAGTQYGTILSMAPDGSDLQVYAEGVRNSVGFDWHPATGELWFSDNGRDGMGDDVPPDELNHAPQPGLHFGFPYCHGGTIADPQFGGLRSCDEFTPPAQTLGPHVAALGMRFYTGDLFPQEFHNQVFIAEHGSWDRTERIGYRITLVRLAGDEATSYEVFAEGWLGADGQFWGRPVDVEVMPDGSLLVSDDFAGAIYRIWYEPTNDE